jgi:hypothetical protein
VGEENQPAVLVVQSLKNRRIVYIKLEDNHLRLDGSEFKNHDLPDAQTSGVECPSPNKASVSVMSERCSDER